MDGKMPFVFLLAVPETNTQQPALTPYVFIGIFCEEQIVHIGIDTQW